MIVIVNYNNIKKKNYFLNFKKQNQSKIIAAKF